MVKQYFNDGICRCGKVHSAAVDDVIIGKGAIGRLMFFVQKYGTKKPFLLSDRNTFVAAGEKVCQILDKNYLPYTS